jgi:quinol-cytochrome oxidoreductase complex cytochrome b subunit
MSFREKTAWITLIALSITSLLFILHPPSQLTLAPEPSFFSLHVLLLSIATFVIIEIVAIVVVRIRAPRDAKAPLDERERLLPVGALHLLRAVLRAPALDARERASLSMTAASIPEALAVPSPRGA